jgi:hypothetical protein
MQAVFVSRVEKDLGDLENTKPLTKSSSKRVEATWSSVITSFRALIVEGGSLSTPYLADTSPARDALIRVLGVEIFL